MSYVSLFAVAALLSLGACQPTSPSSPLAASLDPFRWEYRLVLCEDEEGDALSSLENRKAGLHERDVLWFCMHDGLVFSNYFEEIDDTFGRYLKADFFDRYQARAILIGKDGGVKSIDAELDLDRYFALIDAMPMRRAELQAAQSIHSAE